MQMQKRKLIPRNAMPKLAAFVASLAILMAMVFSGCKEGPPSSGREEGVHRVLRSGIKLHPKPGTELDAEELEARQGLGTTLSTLAGSWWVEGENTYMEELLAAGLQEREAEDGRRVLVGQREGDADGEMDCQVLVPVSESIFLGLRRPAEGMTCEPFWETLADWLPSASLPQASDASLLTGEISQDLSFGTKIGTFNGVDAYANGSTSYNSGSYSCCGLKWQCVELANRYGYLKLGLANLKGTGHAKSYYGTAPSKGLAAYPNGGPMRPAVGDLITSAGGTYGHIAVVREVGTTYLKVIHQNWSNTTADASLTLKMTASGGKYTVSGFSSSYPIQGWLRKAPTVSSVTPSVVSLNKLTTFTVKGTNLPSTLAAWIDGCTGLTMLSVSSAQAQFRCTPGYSKGTKKAVLKTYSGGYTLREWSVQVN